MSKERDCDFDKWNTSVVICQTYIPVMVNQVMMAFIIFRSDDVNLATRNTGANNPLARKI